MIRRLGQLHVQPGLLLHRGRHFLLHQRLGLLDLFIDKVLNLFGVPIEIKVAARIQVLGDGCE